MIRTQRRALGLATLAIVLLGVSTACAATSGPDTSPASTESTTACHPPRNESTLAETGAVTGPVRVLAAASLTASFGKLADAFEHAHPRATVTTSFGASSALVARLHQGAPADVVATADTETMDTAATNGDVTDPVTFTCNRMAILTAKGNPLGITTVADLARSDVRFVLCAAPVPCGRLGRAVLTRADIDASPVGSEANVEAVVAKVISGEVDAGIVYVTDADAVRGRADGVPIPEKENITTTYPIAVTTGADHPESAAAFVKFVRSATGQRILDGYGFDAT